jgi:hypothetical protein
MSMKHWIAIALLAACGGKKDEGGGGGSGGGGGDTKPDPNKVPEAVTAWMPKDAANAFAGAWSSRLMWGGKKGSMSMAGNPVAMQITGGKAKVFDGYKEAELTFTLETPCKVEFGEAVKGGTQLYGKTYLIRDGALQMGDGAVGYRKGKTGLVCGEGSMEGAIVVDEKGCTKYGRKFGDKWASEAQKCAWSQQDGKDLLTIGDGNWATKVFADGDYLVSDQFKESVKLTTKAASWDEAKADVTAKVKEKDPVEIAKQAGGEVGKTDTIASLAATYGTDPKNLDGKPLEITALHYSTSTMTSNGKKSHIVSLVDSKEQTKITLSCHMKEDPPADIKQYDKVTAKGTVKESFGTAGLEDCTLAKAK